MNATLTAPERWHARMHDWSGWEGRPHLDGVYAVEHQGVRWVVASNGHEFVAEPSDRPADPFPDMEAWDGVPCRERLVPLLERPDGAVPVYRWDLAAWSGDPHWPHRCLSCDSTGEAPCSAECSEWCEADHACADCGGWGCTGEEIAFGRIGPMLVNRSKVAHLLSLLEGDVILVHAVGEAPGVVPMLYLSDGSGLIARVAGLQCIEGFTPPAEEIPAFELPSTTEAAGVALPSAS